MNRNAGPFIPPRPRDNLLWIGVDLDGTLAKPIWSADDPSTWYNVGEPIWENVAKLERAVEAGKKPIIYTARAWGAYELIEAWLIHYDIPFKAIACGKPLYAAYIDDLAVPADAESWLP